MTVIPSNAPFHAQPPGPGVPEFGCLGNLMRLRSGQYFDLVNPQPEQITLSDIAGSLARANRFNGHYERFEYYTVAEHSVHCLTVAIQDGLPVDGLLAVFAHDWHEAITGDPTRPMKRLLPGFHPIQQRVDRILAARFGIDFAKWAREIKEIDDAMLVAERRFLFSDDGVRWEGEETVRQLRVDFQGWSPNAAEQVFLGYARRLLREI